MTLLLRHTRPHLFDISAGSSDILFPYNRSVFVLYNTTLRDSHNRHMNERIPGNAYLYLLCEPLMYFIQSVVTGGDTQLNLLLIKKRVNMFTTDTSGSSQSISIFHRRAYHHK